MSLVSAYQHLGIHLKPIGAYWRSQCPFHKEDDPSFTVYADGSYYCFGCKKHGSLEALYKDLKNEIVFSTAPLDFESTNGKEKVNFFEIIRTMEQERFEKDGTLAQRSKLYKRALLARMFVRTSTGGRDTVRTVKKIGKIFGL